jgi:hypothetical protein
MLKRLKKKDYVQREIDVENRTKNKTNVKWVCVKMMEMGMEMKMGRERTVHMNGRILV